jgi:lipopolysaccharide biosynthesis protein
MPTSLAAINQQRDGAKALDLLESLEQQMASARSSVATQLQTVGSAESVRATLKALNADDKPVFRERFRAVCEFCGIKLADYLA